MAVDLQALRTELDTDPLTYGYSTLTDGDAADAMNNMDDAHGRTVNNDDVDTGLIRGSISYDAFQGLATAEEAWFKWLTANGVIPVTADSLQQLAGIPTANDAIWAVADRTEANAAMAALMTRVASRAIELFGVPVSARNVIDARALP